MKPMALLKVLFLCTAMLDYIKKNIQVTAEGKIIKKCNFAWWLQKSALGDFVAWAIDLLR